MTDSPGVLQRDCAVPIWGWASLENPTFIPSFPKFQAMYEKAGIKQHVLLLQGHPDMWVDPARWEGFTKIIDYLRSKNSTFMTPSEYAATVASTQTTANGSSN